jgi:hypothetical protein
MLRPTRRGKPTSPLAAIPVPVLALVAIATLIALAAAGILASLAILTAQGQADAQLRAASIFSAGRSTTAFKVTDVSSGSAVDGSSSSAFGADGRFFLTRPWSASFDPDRYIEIEFNSPLPAALSLNASGLTVRLASNTADATTCYYVQLRRLSTGSLLATHGSSGNPVGCVTGTSFATVNLSLPALDRSDLANDLVVRLYVRDSFGGAARLDQVVITGSTPFQSFTLYSILTREKFDGQTETIRWSLAGP